MSILTAALLDAACLERDRRAESYPAKIQAGADAEPLTVDFQCWVAIAEWLDTDRFHSFTGGADPDRADAPIIRWPELEAAAELAHASVKGDDEASQLRRARLFAIHARVQHRRRSIDLLNNEFRARRVQVAA